MVGTPSFHCGGHRFDSWFRELGSCMPLGMAKRETVELKYFPQKIYK